VVGRRTLGPGGRPADARPGVRPADARRGDEVVWTPLKVGFGGADGWQGVRDGGTRGLRTSHRPVLDIPVGWFPVARYRHKHVSSARRRRLVRMGLTASAVLAVAAPAAAVVWPDEEPVDASPVAEVTSAPVKTSPLPMRATLSAGESLIALPPAARATARRSVKGDGRDKRPHGRRPSDLLGAAETRAARRAGLTPAEALADRARAGLAPQAASGSGSGTPQQPAPGGAPASAAAAVPRTSTRTSTSSAAPVRAPSATPTATPTAAPTAGATQDVTTVADPTPTASTTCTTRPGRGVGRRKHAVDPVTCAMVQ
jgi:hypothetical protein